MMFDKLMANRIGMIFLEGLARNSDLKRSKSLISIPNFDKDAFGRRVHFLIALEALVEYLLKPAASIQ